MAGNLIDGLCGGCQNLAPVETCPICTGCSESVGPEGHKNHPAVALAGRVPLKVMAKYGAIEIGDLLVSSPFPGYAMKCADRNECIGAIIGKAMEPLKNGVGKIMVQVMLR